MVDFHITDGYSVKLVLRTDLIGFLRGADKFTILGFNNANDNASEIALMTPFTKGSVYSVSQLKQWALTNNLKVDAAEIGSSASLQPCVERIDAPSNFTATRDGTLTTSRINLAWSAVSGATGYQIERSTDSNFATTSVVYTGTNTSFANTGLASGTTYYYRIKATSSVKADSLFSTASASTAAS